MVAQDQSSSLHPFHRVGSQLIETILAHRQISKAAARDRAIDLLELTGIPAPHRRVDQLPDELSPSMRRRASIAIALANEPKLLVADEPTSGLDLTVQAEILELLGRVQQRLCMAIVLFSRDMSVAAELAEEICVMSAGEIVERAPTGRILDSPQHPYTSALLRASTWPRAKEAPDQPAITPRPRHTATPEPAPGRADPRA
jgi:ABC-type dipeptide/oligopeptide/nickel transport system ATPase component